MLPIIISLLIAGVTAAFAHRKGYNPLIWFFAAGVLGLIILAFLPFVNEKSKLPAEERPARKRKGDIIGGVIAGIAILLLITQLALNF